MKKVSLFISALLISMSSMAQMYLWQDGNYTIANLDSITFRAPVLGDIPNVAPTAGAYTVVWNAVDYSECNGLVFAGNYNNYNIDAANMVKFEKIEGYTNWYKAVIVPIVPIDQLEGKPCALAADGTFPASWEHQWISGEGKPCEIISGNAGFQIEYETETLLIVSEIGSVVYVRSYQFKYDPCVVEPVYDVMFNLAVASAVPADVQVYVVGDFAENKWVVDAYPMTRIDDTHFTATIKANMGRWYKYVANGSWDYEMLEFPENGRTCSQVPDNKSITGVTVADYVYGFKNINATWCGDTQYAVLDNFTISDYGLFGDVEYIPNSTKYVQLTNGDSLLCQLGYITFISWSDGLVFTNGKGFSGDGFIFQANMPIYWVVEGEDAGKYIGSAGGFRVDTCSIVKPYIAKAGELLDLEKYGDYFTQRLAWLKDNSNNVDNSLYYDAQTGTQFYKYNADEGSTSYNYGNVKKAQFLRDRDENGNALPVQYSATLEWYDFANEGRFLGLKATFDENGNIESIVKPYDMNTITMEYTNIAEGKTAPRKVEAKNYSDPCQYILGDQSRLHLGENPFAADAKRVVKK